MARRQAKCLPYGGLLDFRQKYGGNNLLRLLKRGSVINSWEVRRSGSQLRLAPACKALPGICNREI